MRLFTAIELSDTMRQQLAMICFGVPGIRWSPPAQLHLTLAFIGEVNPALVDEIGEALCEIDMPTLTLNAKGIGSFPSGILWMGVEASPGLLALAASIRRRLNRIHDLKLGHQRFTPHITLGRFSRGRPPPLQPFIMQHSLLSLSWQTSHFGLFASQLNPKGAIHQKLGDFPCH